jgi:hypothetical protein
MNLAILVALAALWPSPEDKEVERPGPPTRQRRITGTSGPITREVFQEEYSQSADLTARRHPYEGAVYFTRPFKYAVLQGQGVYRYRNQPLHLIHNYTCEQPAEAGQVPWTCKATVFVMKGSQPRGPTPDGMRPREVEDAGVRLITEKEGAEIDGAFEEIAPHPSRPLFAGINHGCCDSPARVSVHDFDGRLLCPPADLYLGDVETGPWDKLPIEADTLRCPGGQRVKVPQSLVEEATSLVRRHGAGVLSRYRLSEASDIQGDWKDYAGRHGHAPVFAYGDYNNDGESDLAFLLPLRRPSRPGVGFGLFCLLSQEDQSFRLMTVEENEHGRVSVHGLETIRPGRHPTLCGLPGTPGPECRDQPKEVALQTDAIHLHAFESSGAFYIWDTGRGTFRRVPVAD